MHQRVACVHTTTAPHTQTTAGHNLSTPRARFQTAQHPVTPTRWTPHSSPKQYCMHMRMRRSELCGTTKRGGGSAAPHWQCASSACRQHRHMHSAQLGVVATPLLGGHAPHAADTAPQTQELNQPTDKMRSIVKQASSVHPGRHDAQHHHQTSCANLPKKATLNPMW